MDCTALSAYIQTAQHCIHKRCVRTTLQNHKWRWTLGLSFYYCFFHPAVKTPAFIDNYLNPAYKLSLTCINKFPTLCNASVCCVDQTLDHSHECYHASYQGFPHSKHPIIGTYPKFWNFEPGITFNVLEFNYMLFTEQLDNSLSADFTYVRFFTITYNRANIFKIVFNNYLYSTKYPIYSCFIKVR